MPKSSFMNPDKYQWYYLYSSCSNVFTGVHHILQGCSSGCGTPHRVTPLCISDLSTSDLREDNVPFVEVPRVKFFVR